MRLLVLALMLANAGYWAWSTGALLPYGVGPAVQTEPERMQAQIRPQALRVLSAPEAEQALAQAARAATPTQCLESARLSQAQAALLREQLSAQWPADAWRMTPWSESARWIIYIGPLSRPDALARKQQELHQRKVAFEAYSSAELGPGLSLGTYATQEQAQAQLSALTQRGVRTARVVQTAAASSGEQLRLPAVTAALQQWIPKMAPYLGEAGLTPCPAPPN